MAGYEVGPSNRMACTQCQPGTYKPAPGTPEGNADFCTECAVNTFNAFTGRQQACEPCSRGYSTQGEGNIACDPCPLGFYSATEGSSCVEAPAGSYVNTTAAWAFTLCPLGHFSKELASDNCDPCPPGQFANSPGAKACKARTACLPACLPSRRNASQACRLLSIDARPPNIAHCPAGATTVLRHMGGLASPPGMGASAAAAGHGGLMRTLSTPRSSVDTNQAGGAGRREGSIVGGVREVQSRG